MSAIPDSSRSEEWVFQTTLEERYGRDSERQYAGAEIRLNPSDRDLTRCPAVYWQADQSARERGYL